MKNKFEFYRTTFDPLVARLYNNVSFSGKRCKHCYGRGYFVTEVPVIDRDPLGFATETRTEKVHSYCQCVQKNIKKQQKDQKKQG